ncbi:MAG: response regulator [Halioglobus sp.]
MSNTLLLVDDHPMFRRGVKELIIKHSDLFDEVIEADDGIEALETITKLQPAYIVLDIAMPEMDGLQTLEAIKRESPETRCIILSMYDNPEFVIRARKLGAHAYILKTDSDDIILECLQCVANGRHYVSAAINNSVVPTLPDTELQREDFEGLSNREKEILALIAKNQTSKEIGQQLAVSLRTIQNHRLNICKKLNISGPNALLKTAIEHQSWLKD